MSGNNKKGFTMIELLAAIVILGILLMIAVPGVTSLMKSFRSNYYTELEETITSSAKEFYTDNKIYRPDGLLKSSYTSIESLIDKKYVENLKDYKGGSCTLGSNGSYVIVVYRGRDEYEYKTCLKCPGDDYITDSSDTYCNSAWLTNDNIEYDFGIGEGEALYVYHETPKEEVREQLLKGISIVKYSDAGAVLDRVALADASKENILPMDIDKINTAVRLDATNLHTTTLTYNYEGVNKNIDVVIYKHKAPIVELISNDTRYTESSWTNNLIITLSKGDDFYDHAGTEIGSFQWFIDGSWKNIDCEMITESTCSVSIRKNVNAKYKFRIITNEGKISDETREYSIMVDVDKPVITINPNGSEPIITVGNTTTNLDFELNANDTGGSDIRVSKYAINTSSTTEPTTFTKFYSDSLDVSTSLEGNKYYIWAQAEDKAGNISNEVWPSNVFHMKYEVIYDANGGSDAPAKTYKKYNTALTLSNTKPTRPGYAFKGWSTTANGSVVYSAGEAYRRNESIRLYAVWAPNVLTVNYYSNYATSSFAGALNTVGASKNVLVRTTTHEYATEYPNGLWNYSTSGSTTYLGRIGHKATGKWGTTTTGGILVDENSAFTSGQELAQALGADLSSGNVTVNIYAQWIANTYTVTYNANNGSGAPDLQTKTHGVALTLRTATPTRTGYTFKNWNTKADGTGTSYASGGSYTTNSNVTLYAQWTANTYTVTYNANGGTVSPISKTVTYDSTYGELTTPTKTGYTFTGWYTEKSDGTEITQNTMVSRAEDHTIYAHWTINSYTVTFDANGGSVSPEEATSNYNTSVTLPTPTRTEYKFNGWYTAKSGGTKIGNAGASYTVTENTTLYARWTINSYTVTFDANGGSVSPEEVAGNYNTSVRLPLPTRAGYKFNGWYTAKSGGTKIGNTGTMYKVTGNTTLYAQWKAISYTVTFDANGGTSSLDEMTVTYDSKYGVLTTAEREGYTFNGWYTEKTGGNKVTSQTIVTTHADHTLYAHWVAKTYTVTYEGNGGATPSIIKQVTYGNKYGTLATTSSFYGAFTGWYTEQSGGTRITENTKVSIAGDHTLYAHWVGANCQPSNSWGNTSASGSIKLNTIGSNIEGLYYKKSTASSYLKTTNSSIEYSGQQHYKFLYYVKDNIFNNSSPVRECYSKYDGLKPYTPYVSEIEKVNNVSNITETCTGLSSTNTSAMTCTVTVTRTDSNKEGEITVWRSFADQPSTDQSGMSGIDYFTTIYTYKDGSTCEDKSEPGSDTTSCSKYWNKAEITATDNAGNTSSKLTINTTWK